MAEIAIARIYVKLENKRGCHGNVASSFLHLIIYYIIYYNMYILLYFRMYILRKYINT